MLIIIREPPPRPDILNALSLLNRERAASGTKKSKWKIKASTPSSANLLASFPGVSPPTSTSSTNKEPVSVLSPRPSSLAASDSSLNLTKKALEEEKLVPTSISEGSVTGTGSDGGDALEQHTSCVSVGSLSLGSPVVTPKDTLRRRSSDPEETIGPAIGRIVSKPSSRGAWMSRQRSNNSDGDSEASPSQTPGDSPSVKIKNFSGPRRFYSTFTASAPTTPTTSERGRKEKSEDAIEEDSDSDTTRSISPFTTREDSGYVRTSTKERPSPIVVTTVSTSTSPQPAGNSSPRTSKNVNPPAPPPKLRKSTRKVESDKVTHSSSVPHISNNNSPNRSPLAQSTSESSLLTVRFFFIFKSKFTE